MKGKIWITCLFSMHCFFGQAQIILRDVFGRNLTGHTITLVDWEGYMANPAIKLTVESSYFPIRVTLVATGKRVYMNTPSSAGDFALKSIEITDAGQKEFYLSIFPDRGSGDEDYTLSVQSNFGTEVFPIHVIDQDSDNPVIDYNIAIDYSHDKPAYNFFADQAHRDLVRQAADDWAFFFQNMNFDTIPANTKPVLIWNDDFAGAITTTNPITFNGFLLDAYGFHSAAHRSGGSGDAFSFQTIKGAPTNLRPTGAYSAEVHGNYSTQGYYPYTDDLWYAASSYTNTMADLYSIAMHEIGHAIGFHSSYPVFESYERKGYVDDAEVVAYQGTTVPVDSVDHLAYKVSSGIPPLFVDRVSKRGAFGSDYALFMPNGRWLITKLNLLVLKAVGYKLKTTSCFKETTIPDQTMANATSGQTYSAAIVADGGIPFYKFEVSSGVLPPGLTMDSFNGQISGTAIQPGSFTFTARVTDYDNKFADRTFTIDVLAALPVKLLGFVATRSNCNAYALSWKTASEENNRGFDVEQSTDGRNFYKTGFVAAGSTTNASGSYSFAGTDLGQGTTYFRLKQMDRDNQFYYSPVIIIQNTCSNAAIVVSPNPVSGWLHIKGLRNEPNTIKLVDVSGRTIANWAKTTQKDFDIIHISKGIYFLLINETAKFKIVKE